MREYTFTVRYIVVVGGPQVNYSIKLAASDIKSAKDEAIQIVKATQANVISAWVYAITATGPSVE